MHDPQLAAGRRSYHRPVQIPLGFRLFRFDPEAGFLLNGKRVQIQGVNRHQSYPGMGNALPDSRQWKDMQLIRDMGANFWRTSHYPPAPVTMDASDKLGRLSGRSARQ